jgi:glycine hydroxymethyltransferase
MSYLKKIDAEVYDVINNEKVRLNESLELIASENVASNAVLEAQGSVFTNKYAEGYPGKRYYEGCDFADDVESLAINRAKDIFGAEHVNVQPHSGTTANIAVYLSVLEVGDVVMGMDLSCGGDLSHGHPLNFSGKFFKIVYYGVSRDTNVLDYNEIQEIALKNKPKMIVCGASAYAREIDFKKFKEIADSVGAYLLADISHIAGLVATGTHPSPVAFADFVTTTTHKTLCGPRAGMILCKEKYAKQIDRTIFPGLQGGPLMHAIAAKAVAFKQVLQESFKQYIEQVIKNAKKMAEILQSKGYKIVSGGTDTHLFLVDLTSKNITGKDAASLLQSFNITVNKNTIPFDTKSPFVTSGIRIGTPSVTARGMKEKEMELIADLIDKAICGNMNVKDDVVALSKKFPSYL